MTRSATNKGMGKHVWLATGIVMLSSLMVMLASTATNVAQSILQVEMEANPATVAWTITGFTLAVVATIPLAPWMTARFGVKRVYIWSLIVFIIGSILCGLAWDISTLIIFRVIKGFGGGLILPVGFMILTLAAGAGRVGRVMGLLGIPSILGPAIGPFIAGVLIERFTWHWAFFMTVPIGFIAVIGAVFILRRDTPSSKPTIDVPGLLLLPPGLAFLILGVTAAGNQNSASTAGIWVPMVLGIVLLTLFVFHTLRKKTGVPLLDLTLFLNPTVTQALTALFIFMVAFMGVGYLIPQYLIGVRGVSTEIAGLLLTPQGIGAGIMMLISGVVVDKAGPGKSVLTGISFCLLGILPLVFVGPQTPLWLVGIALFTIGLGSGMSMMPLTSAVLSALRSEQIPDGSTLVNVVQQTGIAIGLAVYSSILSMRISQSPGGRQAILSNSDPSQGGITVPWEYFEEAANIFGSNFLIAAILATLTFLPAVFLPRKPIAK